MSTFALMGSPIYKNFFRFNLLRWDDLRSRWCALWWRGRGNAITPVKTRKTDNLIWDKEDDRRVVELGKWMQNSMVEDIRILRTLAG